MATTLDAGYTTHFSLSHNEGRQNCTYLSKCVQLSKMSTPNDQNDQFSQAILVLINFCFAVLEYSNSSCRPLIPY